MLSTNTGERAQEPENGEIYDKPRAESVAEDHLNTGFEAEILKFRDYARTRVNFSKTCRICQDWTEEATI